MTGLRSEGAAVGTAHVNQLRARAMYQRGEHFLLAAVLLERYRGDGFAVLYLLCQSVEVMLKAVLILRDYAGNKSRLKRFGHDISKLAKATSAEFKLKPLDASLKKELDHLNGLYCSSAYPLRYASFLDILVDPQTIPRALVFRRLMAVQRLVRRRLSQTTPSA